MVEITRAARVPNVEAEYCNFLYATIGTEANGTSLSVLSAMARMNLDPWREAASLAGMSGKAAVSRLSSLIEALPGRPSVPDDPEMIALRLVKLLPQQSALSLPLLQQSRPASALTQQNRLAVPPYLLGIVKVLSSKSAIYVVVLLIAVTLGVQWFVANKSPPANVPMSQTTPPQNVPLSH